MEPAAKASGGTPSSPLPSPAASAVWSGSVPFEKALLSIEAREALLQVQDTEQRLFECMRRCMLARAKCDREYAASLEGVAQLAQRLGPSPSDATAASYTSIFTTWSKIMEETSTLALMLHKRAESITTGVVDKLAQLIADRNAARKTFADEKAQSEKELRKVQEALGRLHSDYCKAMERVKAKRAECQELQQRGKLSKTDDARRKYLIACENAHNAHNEYLLCVKETRLFYNGVHRGTIPQWLSTCQKHMESSIAQCKQILQDFVKATDMSTVEYQAVYKNMAVLADGINANAEYTSFVQTHRKDFVMPAVEFDASVFQGYVGSLVPNELSVNTATTEALMRSRYGYEDRVAEADDAVNRLTSQLRAASEATDKSRLGKQLEVDGLSRRADDQRLVVERLIQMLQYVGEKLKASSTNGGGGGEQALALPPMPEAAAEAAFVGSDDGTAYSATAAATSATASAANSATAFGSAAAAASAAASATSSAAATAIPAAGSSGGGAGSALQTAEGAEDSNGTGGSGGAVSGSASSSSRRSGVDAITNTFTKLYNKMKTVSDLMGSTSKDYADGGGGGAATAGDNPTVTSSRSQPIIAKKLSNNSLLPKSDSSKELAAAAADGEQRQQHRLHLKKKAYESSQLKGDNSQLSPEVDVPNGGKALKQSEVTEAKRALEDLEWFHGILPREEIQRLLRDDGDFLVRESKKRETQETLFVLSVMWQGPKHFIIQSTEAGGWKLEGQAYPSIRELIEQQSASGCPVTVRTQALLVHPIPRETWQLNNDHIVLECKIGNGNFGEVFKGTYNGSVVAVKTCKEELSDEQKRKFIGEGRILRQYDHPNIVQFIGIAAQKNPVMIVMEYVAGGALLTWLRKHEGEPHRTLVGMCIDAALGMEYLAAKSVIHRDLAARNCLVAAEGKVKISDFGMSREESEYIMSAGNMRQIPIKWTAPEALNYGRYTTMCDVWSYGILMWEVFSYGKNPYPGMRNQEARERVDQGYRMGAPASCLPAVYELMLRCWMSNAEQRPPFTQLIKDLRAVLETL